MTTPDPVSIWQGTFNVFGVALRCHILSDGRRIIEADSVTKLLDVWAGAESEIAVEAPGIDAFLKWQKGKAP